MIKRVVVFCAGLFGLLLLVSVVGALLQGGRTTNYVLRSGELIQGDLTVAAQDVTLEPGSTITGNLSIFAVNRVTLGGRITGKVSILAPTAEVKLTEGTLIEGDIAVCGRTFAPAARVTIRGSRSVGCNQLSMLAGGVSAPAALTAIQSPIFNRPSGSLGAVLTSAFSAAAVGGLLALFFPRPIRVMAETVLKEGRTSATVGFISIGAALGLSVVYGALSILTQGLMCVALPVVVIGWATLTFMLIVGWIGVAYPLGAMLLRRMNVTPSPIPAAVLGALSLTFVQGLLDFIPCVGTLAIIAIGSVGLGAVLLTRFGFKPYPEMIHLDYPL